MLISALSYIIIFISDLSGQMTYDLLPTQTIPVKNGSKVTSAVHSFDIGLIHIVKILNNLRINKQKFKRSAYARSASSGLNKIM